MTQPFALGTPIWITTNDGIEIIKRFEEQTDTHLHCDRGLPIPLSNIKRVRQARGSIVRAVEHAEAYDAQQQARYNR